MLTKGRKAPVRVMIVVTRLNLGGIALHVSLLASRLNPTRFRSTLVFGTEAAGEGSMRDIAEAAQADLMHLPSLGRAVSPLNDLRSFFQLWQLFRREQPLLVHTHTAKAGSLGRLAARLAGVPLVVHTFHGHVFHSYFNSFWSRLVVSVEQILGRLTDRVVVVSSALQDDILRHGIARAGKVSVIPTGFDLSPYVSARANRGEFRAAVGLHSEAVLVGIVGRLVPVKNHRLFLAAAKQVPADLNCHWVIVGDGELRGDLEKEVASLGVADRVIFTGWRRDLPAVYADLDLLALASLNEGAPLTLIEAMAAGCPVVATRVGGVPDVVQDGVTGRLVESGDVEGLAQAIREALTDRERTRQMAEAARADVCQRYTVEALVRNTEALYERLLREKGLL